MSNQNHSIHLENEFGVDLAVSLSSPLYQKEIEYTDKKGKKKTKKNESAEPVLYAKLIYSKKCNKISSLFRTKGGKNVILLIILTNISSYSVIVPVRVVSHLQSQVNSVCQSMALYVWSIERDLSV